MDRMEHIRGKLLDGERVVLNEVDGFLGHHDKPNGRKSYFGYFELPTEQLAGVEHNSSYHLALSDGRGASIFTEIVASNKPGMSLAEFHVTGALTKKVLH